MTHVKAFSGSASQVEAELNHWGELGYDVLDVKLSGTGYSSSGGHMTSGHGEFLVVITYREPE